MWCISEVAFGRRCRGGEFVLGYERSEVGRC